MGSNIFRGKRGHCGHLRRRGGGRYFTDFKTLCQRAGNTFRQNDLCFPVANRADDFYSADIFNPVRRDARKNSFITCNAFTRLNRRGGGGHFDSGVDDFGDSQGRIISDFAFPDNASDFPTGDFSDGNFFHGRGV